MIKDFRIFVSNKHIIINTMLTTMFCIVPHCNCMENRTLMSNTKNAVVPQSGMGQAFNNAGAKTSHGPGLVINGNIYNIYHYMPDTVHINSKFSAHSLKDSIRDLPDNKQEIVTKNKTMQKSLISNPSIALKNDQAFQQIVSQNSYETVFMDNKKLSNRDDALLKKLHTITCNPTSYKLDAFQLYSYPLNIKMANTVLNSLKSIFNPDLI